MRIHVVQGDITEQHVDAIVNATGASLVGGGGVSGPIHRGGGATILAELRQLHDIEYRTGLPTGQAVATTAGNLRANWVIHTVGPVHSPDEDRSELLACIARGALNATMMLVRGSLIQHSVASAGITVRSSQTDVACCGCSRSTRMRGIRVSQRSRLLMAGVPPRVVAVDDVLLIRPRSHTWIFFDLAQSLIAWLTSRSDSASSRLGPLEIGRASCRERV